MIVGHQHLVRDFKTLVKSGKLAHAYIFFGEPEVGKFYFAKHLANLLENGEFEAPLAASAQLRRPLQDALILENAKGIEEMRGLRNFLWQKPAISSKRLAVINNAENLTPQAQNAVLKIAEEPPENALLVLIANSLENILPALISRLQKIYFGRLNDQEMRDFLQAVELPALAGSGTPHRNDYVISGAWGRPGRAMRLLNDPATKQAEKYAAQFLKTKDFGRSRLIKELVEEQKERPELLDRFFEALILQLRRDAKNNAAIIQSALHRLFLIKSYNTNKRLQLEAI